MVDEVLTDVEASRLDSKHKELFRYLGKLVEHSTRVNASDINRLKEAGWSEEAIYDALTVASLFQFYNTWIDGAGVKSMNSADCLNSGKRLSTMGYCMHFDLKALVKVIRAEGILKIFRVGRRDVNGTTAASRRIATTGYD